jgi:hypothetical protein
MGKSSLKHVSEILVPQTGKICVDVGVNLMIIIRFQDQTFISRVVQVAARYLNRSSSVARNVASSFFAIAKYEMSWYTWLEKHLLHQ